MNLCTNAAQSMGEKGGALSISLAEKGIGPFSPGVLGLPPGQYVELVVKDNGTGMDAEVMKRIFEPLLYHKGSRRGPVSGFPWCTVSSRV